MIIVMKKLIIFLLFSTKDFSPPTIRQTSLFHIFVLLNLCYFLLYLPHSIFISQTLF